MTHLTKNFRHLVAIVTSPPIIFTFICLLYAISFSVLAIIRHRHFFSQGWDLGLYDQIIWQYSQGKLAVSSFTNLIDLADRFRPILLLIVPVYRLFPHPETILIIQVL